MKNWQHKILTNEQLKELVRGVYDCKYFTSLQCRNMAMSVFMPLLFLGSEPSKPNFPKSTNDIRKDRKNKILHLDELEKWKIELQEWKDQTEEREKYFENIGMVYEENSKAGPSSINGYPIFMSCIIVSKDDTARFLEMYRKYEKMREEFEKEWGTEKVD